MALLGLPQLMGTLPEYQGTPPIAAPETPPADAFIWGQGGAMLTPDELANRRSIAQSLMQSDYSPISSVWQGLGRVADNVFGALDARKLDKQAETATARSNSIAQALLGKGGGDVAAQALVDPYVSDEVRKLAQMQWERANPKPVNNDTAADLALIEGRLGVDAGTNFLLGKSDPLVTIPLPGGTVINAPRSQIPAIMSQMTGGSGRPAGGGMRSPPPEAVAELRRDPSSAADFDEVFGAGSAAKILGTGGPAPQASGGF